MGECKSLLLSSISLNTFGNFIVMPFGIQNVSAAVENSLVVPQKVKHRIVYDLAIPLLANKLKGIEKRGHLVAQWLSICLWLRL